MGWMQRIARLLRHRWAEGRLRQAVPPPLIEQLTRQVAASEQRHTGQVRICVEAGLPVAYLWRGAPARERAVSLFGKLRVWDTEHNNGVLIYLLLADHAIEVVADRGLARAVPQATWEGLVAGMGQAFQGQRYDEGLTEALARVSALLEEHFPAPRGSARAPNELPDAPVLTGDPLLRR
ncbi:hypothetical protein B2J86_15460 [Acidovorax sp. SRB_14]|uniref:TPM domain-containing protein n=1 Tax=unclassified Acidovorax TaxID=2684926 RepID=UPI00145DCBD1|nr:MULTISPECIES: TPM domain-containing protein [unclassified Acidovorax]NMM75980.1 hypothetical protein [Acidovorax sp. SRB_24]NMM82312.1 hypothetical protein [Acidovorax sp. SRB_14]NMM90149.1 hypothetical protein [Rhodococcus sp. SRB_17]